MFPLLLLCSILRVFTLFIDSFAVKNLISLIRSHLFIFGFISIILGGESWKIMLQFMSYTILPMCSSKSFIVSGLKLKTFSFYPFVFIFVYSVMKSLNFILLHIVVQFFQHQLLGRLYFPHYIFVPPFSEIRCPWMHGFLSCLSILFCCSIHLCFFFASAMLSGWL